MQELSSVLLLPDSRVEISSRPSYKLNEACISSSFDILNLYLCPFCVCLFAFWHIYFQLDLALLWQVYQLGLIQLQSGWCCCIGFIAALQFRWIQFFTELNRIVPSCCSFVEFYTKFGVEPECLIGDLSVIDGFVFHTALNNSWLVLCEEILLC